MSEESLGSVNHEGKSDGLGKETPNIEVRVKWHRIEGEPAWRRLWAKLLAPREKEQINDESNGKEG